ncbi:hypothetical protein GUITHDRAFT_113879 [Guillardia theta CCMP2712]|uniref:Uncharacterized protein n=1 Tax=Guillardia theta (strain CCMP2712) TaxID=905079 RepID=L1IVJ8_GUITC|nr:hypothetical protein GUITHDRAFT_113879 [Guillardia theta CCMP2712]EKX40142.1 hypothetical protein GUITHDRAFT_113879 [Guillardia theta CCMP2712]|eukprot:XP_005827122.1 hypothetical protein GUITHDRAFT_113879 [Guillardia theta CCMP2712]
MQSSPDHDCFRTRGVLSRDTIVEIYKLRTNDKKIKTAASASVGLKHGVTAKAIRDIWNRRTWWNVTEALWTEEEREDYARRRKPCGKAGRPRGSKDSKPRKSRRKQVEPDQAEGQVKAQESEKSESSDDDKLSVDIEEVREWCHQQVDEEEEKAHERVVGASSTTKAIGLNATLAGLRLSRAIHLCREELMREALEHVTR